MSGRQIARNLQWRKWYERNKNVLQDVLLAVLQLQRKSIQSDTVEKSVFRGTQYVL